MKGKQKTEESEEFAYEKPSEQVRKSVLNKIRTLLVINSWTQQEAAHFCGQSQPRISDLCRGNTDRFSLDALVDIAAALELHSKCSKGSAMQESVDEGQHMVVEFLAKLVAKPVKGCYPLATEESTTERGGKIIATSEMFLREKRIGLVGDIVRYQDGSETRIISGTGVALVCGAQSAALVGSELENGDTITGPIHNDSVIIQYADEPPIEGLLDPAFVSKPYQGEDRG